MELDVLVEHHVASICTSIDRRRLEHTISILHELVMDAVGEQGLAPAGPLFTRYHHLGSVVTLEAGIPLSQPIEPVGVISASTLPGGPTLHAEHTGAPLPTLDRFADLEQYCSTHGLRATGAPWESYAVDRRDTPDERDWVTEVFLPVRSVATRLRRTPFGTGRGGWMVLPRDRSIR